MSVEITTAFVEQYSANIHTLAQQRGSRLMGATRIESVRGKNAFFERIGATAAQQRTTRHGDTPLMNTPHSRRRVSLTDYDWADLVDDLDMVRTLIDPTNAYVNAGGMAMGRSIDDVIIAAMFGTAYSGVDGSTSVSFPAGNQIAHGSAGMTITKLRTAKRLLDENEKDPSLRRFCALSAKQIQDLLATTEVTSSDFNTIKALVHGEINTFLGFEFIRTERLDTDGGTARNCCAWTEDAIILGMGATPVAKISERADKNHSTQVYYSMALGSTRLEEEGVIQIACTEA